MTNVRGVNSFKRSRPKWRMSRTHFGYKTQSCMPVIGGKTRPYEVLLVNNNLIMKWDWRIEVGGSRIGAGNIVEWVLTRSS